MISHSASAARTQNTAVLRQPCRSVQRRSASCSAADCQNFHVLAFADMRLTPPSHGTGELEA